jgi:hypothetical protein
MRQQHNGRSLSLEARVRAMKLLKVDGAGPQEILTDLENTFGIKIAHSNWERPERFLKRIEEGIVNLCLQDGPHLQRLLKLLKQAQLIQSNGDDDNE